MHTEPGSPHRDLYTVTRLNREVRAILEGSFPPVWVQGEISNLARPASGHLYFSLKDKHSQVRCAMFKNRNQILKFTPENGMEVITQAGVSLYEGRGEFQLLINQMEPAGIGALQLAFEQLKERLSKEGLFDEQHKKPVPVFPRQIGIVTSPTGAAIRDILHVLQRRYRAAGVIIYPVVVQGEGSAAMIAEAITTAGHRNECDVLVLARGGGSMEDLWSFNDEKVARAIFQCAIPVVTGIGHEIDFTIADFVADKRAPTPSAAAELVSPDRNKLVEHLKRLYKQIYDNVHRSLQTYREVIQRCAKRLPHPAKQLQNISQHLDESGLRMVKAIRYCFGLKRSHVYKLHAGINQFNPVQRLKLHKQKCIYITGQLRSALFDSIKTCRNRLEVTALTLHTISPLATLERGYAIVTKPENGRVIRSINEVEPGKETRTQIANGSFRSTITNIFKNDK